MDLVFRAVVLFGAVYLLLRVVGRRELAQMTPIDFILLIVLGDAIQQGLTQDDYSVTGALLVIITIAVLQVVLGYLTFRSSKLRVVMDGEPIVLVEDGRIVEKNLRRSRIAAEELAEEARLSQVSSVKDIAWAVLETSGKISIIPKKS
ncbi:MAG TPA: YetF domain-containing protein [Thermoleophilaceae bacterium]